MQSMNQEHHQVVKPEPDHELNALFDSLLMILRNEIDVYRELQETISLERNVLKHYSADQLLESNARKETVILKAKMLEEVKMNTAGKIARRLGLADRDLRLSVLGKYADTERKKALKACQAILRKLTNDIHKANRGNMELMSLSLQSIVGSINFLNSIVFSGETYAETGRMTSVNPNGRLLSAEG